MMDLQPQVRQALLLQASALLMARFPKNTATFTRGRDKWMARFSWPGVVTVTDWQTGAVAAVSVPGRPGTLASHASQRQSRVFAQQSQSEAVW